MIMLAMAMATATAGTQVDSVQDRCPAAEAQSLIWAPVKRKGVMEEARRIAGRHPLRWIMPGTMTTQDFVPERLNLEVGDDGWIHRAWCG